MRTQEQELVSYESYDPFVSKRKLLFLCQWHSCVNELIKCSCFRVTQIKVKTGSPRALSLNGTIGFSHREELRPNPLTHWFKNNGKKMFYTWHKSARPMSFAWLLVAAAYLMSHTISADNSSIVSHVSCHKLFRIHHQRRYWTCSPYLICFICLSNLCSSTKVCLSHYLFAIPPNLSLKSTM